MKALAAHQYGDFRHVLALQDIPFDTEGLSLLPHEVIVRVAWSDVNPVDLQKLHGGERLTGKPVNAADTTKTFVPGFGGSGIVVRQGGEEESLSEASSETRAPRFPAGTRVSFLVNPSSGHGSYAEYCIVDCRAVAALPNEVSLRDAATLPLAGCTAYEALHKLGLGGGHQPGKCQTLLIVGGAGGVGSWATRLARCWYAPAELEIVATTSSNAEWCLEQGASRCIGHDEIESSLVGGPTGSVDAILCLAEPSPLLMKAMSEVIRPYGHLCLVVAGPSIQSLDMGFCFFKSVNVAFVTVFSCFRTNFASVCPREEMKDMFDMISLRNSLRVPLSPLLRQLNEDWKQATVSGGILDNLQRGHLRGKLVMRIWDDDVGLEL
jgi:NADPH:quinone reductase-like Zn-dependent oxidoreductase